MRKALIVAGAGAAAATAVVVAMLGGGEPSTKAATGVLRQRIGRLELEVRIARSDGRTSTDLLLVEHPRAAKSPLAAAREGIRGYIERTDHALEALRGWASEAGPGGEYTIGDGTRYEYKVPIGVAESHRGDLRDLLTDLDDWERRTAAGDADREDLDWVSFYDLLTATQTYADVVVQRAQGEVHRLAIRQEREERIPLSDAHEAASDAISELWTAGKIGDGEMEARACALRARYASREVADDEAIRGDYAKVLEAALGELQGLRAELIAIRAQAIALHGPTWDAGRQTIADVVGEGGRLSGSEALGATGLGFGLKQILYHLCSRTDPGAITYAKDSSLSPDSWLARLRPIPSAASGVRAGLDQAAMGPATRRLSGMRAQATFAVDPATCTPGDGALRVRAHDSSGADAEFRFELPAVHADLGPAAKATTEAGARERRRFALLIDGGDYEKEHVRRALAQTMDLVQRDMEAKGYTVTRFSANEAGARALTFAGVQDALGRLARTLRPGDEFVLWFHGHGVGRGMGIHPSGATTQEKCGIVKWEDWDRKLDAFPEGVEQVLVLDSCMSGGSLWWLTDPDRTILTATDSVILADCATEPGANVFSLNLRSARANRANDRDGDGEVGWREGARAVQAADQGRAEGERFKPQLGLPGPAPEK